MFGCSHEAKHIAYRALVRPILEYAAIVWCPHIPPAILSCWSLVRVELLVGFVVAIGGHQLHHGLYQHVIVVPNFFSQPFSPDVNTYQCVSSMIFIVNAYPFHFLNTVISTQPHPQGVIVFHYFHPYLPLILEGTHFLLTIFDSASFSRMTLHLFGTHYIIIYVFPHVCNCLIFNCNVVNCFCMCLCFCFVCIVWLTIGLAPCTGFAFCACLPFW